jgi:hypothetical protein
MTKGKGLKNVQSVTQIAQRTNHAQKGPGTENKRVRSIVISGHTVVTSTLSPGMV